MKTKTRTLPEAEYNALWDKVVRTVPPVASNGGPFTSVFMATGDFEPTQNLADVRWIATDSQMDRHLFQVDSAGDAILLAEGD